MPSGRLSNWRLALEAMDLDLLALIIELVMEFEQIHGRRMLPHELRQALTGDLGLGTGVRP